MEVPSLTLSEALLCTQGLDLYFCSYIWGCFPHTLIGIPYLAYMTAVAILTVCPWWGGGENGESIFLGYYTIIQRQKMVASLNFYKKKLSFVDSFSRYQ